MKGLDSLIDTTKVLGLLALTIVSLITGVAVYFSLSLVLKIPETKILSMLFLFLKRKATLKNILAFSGRQIRKQEELIEPPVSH
jgi:hypothetical protein